MKASPPVGRRGYLGVGVSLKPGACGGLGTSLASFAEILLRAQYR
jgi:hypothetical protein